MTATEARKLATGATDPGALKEIYKDIKEAAKAGRTHIFFYRELTGAMRNELSENGFHVYPSQWDSRENGWLTKIEW